MNVLHRLSLGVLVLTIAIGCDNTPPRPLPATDVLPDGPSREIPEIVRPISPEQLAREYETDENAADAKYKDKWVEIDALASSMPRVNGPGVISIGFHGTQKGNVPMTSVVASFKGPTSRKVQNSSEGQQLKLRGRVDGKMGPTVYIADAVLLESGPDPALIVTMSELAKDIGAAPEAAKKKYDNRVVRIEGKVGKIDYSELQLVLEPVPKDAPNNGCAVLAALSVDWRNEGFANITVGQTIALRGKLLFTKGDQITLTQMIRVK